MIMSKIEPENMAAHPSLIIRLAVPILVWV
jgi:hypothetical protein